MARELETFRLPNEWGSKTDDDQNSPRLYLKNTINLDLPISGGWGYSEEDCVVIDMNDPTVDTGKTLDGTGVESVFVEKRIFLCCRSFYYRNYYFISRITREN